MPVRQLCSNLDFAYLSQGFAYLLNGRDKRVLPFVKGYDLP